MDELTLDKIKAFVIGWYRALDFHLPIEDVYNFLADKDLKMQFPDGDIWDYDSFKKWYNRVTNIFFDENHYVKDLKAKINGDSAEVDIVVGWQASWWEPPDAKSKRVCLDATQKWTVRRSKKNTYGLEIVTYNATVLPFEYAPGFAKL